MHELVNQAVIVDVDVLIIGHANHKHATLFINHCGLTRSTGSIIDVETIDWNFGRTENLLFLCKSVRAKLVNKRVFDKLVAFLLSSFLASLSFLRLFLFQ